MKAAEVLDEPIAIGRRALSRIQLGIPARFTGAAGSYRVSLEDLSATGARIRLYHACPVQVGPLAWLNFQVFANLVWQANLWCGVSFEFPLRDECLRQTADFAKLVSTQRINAIRLASAWVHGPGDY
jgi:hypothetical protein